jgi:hypothetical protein
MKNLGIFGFEDRVSGEDRVMGRKEILGLYNLGRLYRGMKDGGL